MQDIDPSTKTKLIIFAILGLAFWGIVAWFFLGRPLFVIEILPAPLPLSVLTFLIFLIGLLFLTLVGTTTVRGIAPRYTWVVMLVSATLIAAYNLSSMAPDWKCFGNRVYVKFANAAGQNCTTTCTDNDKKPCSGWSSCWDKYVSCSSAGIDQGGRPCGGCCFSCKVVCEEEEPTYSPPTVSGSVACSLPGSNGWCKGTSTLTMTASDPQGLALTISGTIAGAPFTCAAGNSCSIALSEGSGAITFKATASTSGLSSATSSTSWARDVSLPTVTPVIPTATGSSGWYITSPIATSTNGTDAVSGVASLQLQVNGGAWQTTTASLPNGIHTVNFRTVDVAGNVSAVASRTIKVDSVPPVLTPNFPAANGSNGWVVTGPAYVSSSGTDTGSGLANASVSVDSGAWVSTATLSDGSHSVQFRVLDIAGNSTTLTRTIKVDLAAPVLSVNVVGTSGNSGWYISPTSTTISATDSTSGFDRIEHRYNGGSWQAGTTVASVDGVNTLEIRAYDLAGNMSTSSRSIKVDTIAPSLNAIYPLPDGLNDWVVTAPALVSAVGTDAGSGLARAHVSVDGGAWQDSAALHDGVITVDFRSEDIAGNTTTTSRTLKVDTTAPDLSFSTTGTPGNSGWYISETETTILYRDGTSGIDHVEYRQNGSNWQGVGKLLSVDGVNTIDARVYDLAGNVANKTLTVKVDTRSPSLAIASSGTLGKFSWYVTNVTTSIETSDQTSGVDIVQYNRNNTGWNNGSTITSTDGINDIDIVVYDVAGNMSTHTTEIKVDTVAPDVYPVMPVPDGSNNWFVSGPVAISANGSDTISGLESASVSTDAETWQKSISLSDGSYRVSFQSVDVAGNTTAVSREIKIDTVAPSIPVLKSGTLGNSGWYVSPVTTDILPTDQTSGIDSIQYNQNGAGWDKGSSITSNDGINDIDIAVYDTAGNVSIESLQVKVDTVAPDVDPVVPAPNGLQDWFVSVPVEISATGSDVTSGLLSALVSTNEGEWKSSLSLTDGVYITGFRSEDVAGNTTNIFRTVKIDSTKPALAISTAGTVGTNGWYTSQTTTTLNADDNTSGIDHVEYSQNNSPWQTGTSVVSSDGINSVSVKAYDKAGNMLTSQVQVKVDTGMPSSTFTSPANGSGDTLARNVLPLLGTSTDALSGIATVELSYDGSKTWIPVTTSTDGKWNYNFDTTKVPDGIYTIMVRTIDMAGNVVVGDGSSESGAYITVIVNNSPPHIKLTPEWFIWDSGKLVIKTDYFPVREGLVIISDPQNRWPKVEIPFGENYPSTIKWDRRFDNGIIAPIGNYHVEVKVCNTYNLCSTKRATIKIPWISVIVPTVSPIPPTAVPTNPAENASERPEIQIPPDVVVEDSSPQVQTSLFVEREPVGIALWLVVFIALMWAVASAALSDRRPAAINAISTTIRQKRNIQPWIQGHAKEHTY